MHFISVRNSCSYRVLIEDREFVFFRVIKKERVVPDIAFNKFRPRQAMIFFSFFFYRKSLKIYLGSNLRFRGLTADFFTLAISKGIAIGC